jgi:CheY-like chemotaxis protein
MAPCCGWRLRTWYRYHRNGDCSRSRTLSEDWVKRVDDKSTKNKRVVVVVDDEPSIVEVVCDALEELDATTIGCSQGTAANALIREARPQLVILDVQMPGVDGVEVFRLMRSEPATSAVPVIFFTANADKLLKRLPDYQASGAALLPKPFNVGRLLDLVEGMLTGQHSQQ